jgi:hypothetical protein
MYCLFFLRGRYSWNDMSSSSTSLSWWACDGSTSSVQFKRHLRMAGVRRPRMREDGDGRVERGEMRRCSVHRKHKEAGWVARDNAASAIRAIPVPYRRSTVLRVIGQFLYRGRSNRWTKSTTRIHARICVYRVSQNLRLISMTGFVDRFAAVNNFGANDRSKTNFTCLWIRNDVSWNNKINRFLGRLLYKICSNNFHAKIYNNNWILYFRLISVKYVIDPISDNKWQAFFIFSKKDLFLECNTKIKIVNHEIPCIYIGKSVSVKIIEFCILYESNYL